MPTVHIARGVSIMVALLFIGMAFYHFAEGLRPVDSFYLAGATLTTLGYGDFVPQTDLGKIFTVAYAIMGIGTIFYISGGVFSFLSKHAVPHPLIRYTHMHSGKKNNQKR